MAKKLSKTKYSGDIHLFDFLLFVGLKVNYIRELHKGVQEIFNPFPTIAVWAAVKFVHKKEHDR